MNGLNKVQLIGYLGKDPESTQTKNGQVFCKFSLATSERGKEGKIFTEWHNITVWGKIATICQEYLKKGDPIYVEGKISTSIREDNGKKTYYTGVTGFIVNFLGQKGGQKKETAPDDPIPNIADSLGAEVVSEDDDIPF